MIHVDVSYDRSDKGLDFPKILVQTSVDGGPWKTQYVQYADVPNETLSADISRTVQRYRAEDTARIFVNGCRFAGAEVRATSFGYAL